MRGVCFPGVSVSTWVIRTIFKKESKTESRDVYFSATRILILCISRGFPVEDQPSVVGHHHGVSASAQ